MTQPKPKILLVEDEKDLAFVVASTLEREGFEVVVARTADSGLTLARRHKPDLVVSDVALPKMDGLEMARRLRAVGAVPVLFLSAKKDEIERVLGSKLGAEDCVPGPFSTAELVRRVRAALRRRERSRGKPA